MSCYCGVKDISQILRAAAHWRDNAMVGEGSVFSSRRVWTVENINALERYFVKNLDEGEGAFLEKLKQQLAPADVGAKQLAAEMMWLTYVQAVSRRPASGLLWKQFGRGLASDFPKQNGFQKAS